MKNHYICGPCEEARHDNCTKSNCFCDCHSFVETQVYEALAQPEAERPATAGRLQEIFERFQGEISNFVADAADATQPEALPSGEPTEEDLKAWSQPEFVAWYTKYAHWDSKEEAYEAWIAAHGKQHPEHP